MGGLVIETIRPGVQFIPDAAAAFRRAEAQVQAEFGRNIDVNSTYRSWYDQMLMFVNWGKYVAGKGPHPGHSKAVHPSESFHVAGIALDSDDWRVPRIVEILAENGFIRNRLHVANENHHFEWLRHRDQNYGKPIGGSAASAPPVPEEDDMPGPDMKLVLWNGEHYFLIGEESIYHVVNGAWIPYLEDHYGPRGTAAPIDNGAFTLELVINRIPWDAVDACMRGAAYGPDKRSWSRLQAEGIAIRGTQAAQTKTLADLLATAENAPKA